MIGSEGDFDGNESSVVYRTKYHRASNGNEKDGPTVGHRGPRLVRDGNCRPTETADPMGDPEKATTVLEFSVTAWNAIRVKVARTLSGHDFASYYETKQSAGSLFGNVRSYAPWCPTHERKPH